ncbi:MAG: DUF885 family protein, partial [Bacteroidota bacterium]
MKYRSLIFLSISVTFLLSCGSDPRSEADRDFEALASRFLERHLAVHPEDATALGDHRFDARMNDYSRAGVDNDIAFFEAYLDTLRGIRVETLSPQYMIDYGILSHNLEESLFELKDLREWEWNPLAYNPGDAVYALIAREFAPVAERMQSIAGRLRGIPAVLEAARANLQHPPSIHTQTAILQNEGTIALLNVTLQPFIEQCPADQQKDV